MLNYVWTALIILGLAAALTTDIQNKMHDPYKNGTPIPVTIVLKAGTTALQKKADASIIIHQAEYAGHFNEQAGSDLMFQTQIDTSKHTKRIPVSWVIGSDAPSKIAEIAKASGKEKRHNRWNWKYQVSIRSKTYYPLICILKKSHLSK